MSWRRKKQDSGKISTFRTDRKSPTIPDTRFNVFKVNGDFDVFKRNFKAGLEIEREHTDDIEVAKKIALDHLKEDLNYYDKLTAIEEIPNEEFEAWLSLSPEEKRRIWKEKFGTELEEE